MRRWAELSRLTAAAVEGSRDILTEVLRRWAALARLPEEPRFGGSWGAVARLISAATGQAEALVLVLEGLVQRWEERLRPVGEPLRMTFPLQRWLAPDREEAYSDWLAWILAELRSFRHLGYILAGENVEELTAAGQWYSVEREVWVPAGHPGRSGRVDCVIRDGNEAVMLLEVKVVPAESADLGKNRGYKEWLDSQPAPLRKAYLVATAGDKRLYEGGFELVTWGEVCGRLRRLLPELVAEGRLVLAALTGAFVGAVEQNLLGIPSLAWLAGGGESGAALVRRSEVLAATDYLSRVL